MKLITFKKDAQNRSKREVCFFSPWAGGALLGILGMLFTGCLKEVQPSDAITSEVLTSEVEGLQNAVNGAYSLFKDRIEFNGIQDDNNMYLRQYFQLSSFAGDNVVCGQVTEDPLFLSFSYDRSPTQANSRYFWYISYKIINDCNTVIEAVEDLPEATSNPEISQLLGEVYFLRAFVHFSLVRLYGRPYSQDKDAPGVILRLTTDEPGEKARASVAEVYAQVIKDARQAAELMNQSRGKIFASKEAAWALLSRVYLYEENNDSTIHFSEEVINSGNVALTNAGQFKEMFAKAQSSPGTIFCIGLTDKEDYGKEGSIASMIFSDGNSGWGEEFVSSSLRELMEKHPEDARWNFVVPDEDEDGDVKLLNGIPKYYDSKFSFQDGSPTLSSPILFRVAEMYLNRAEAYAKKGEMQKALDDVDEIRKNRGLEGSLYNGALPSGKNALEVVLEERRNEFSFEGFRTFDLFRNNLPLVRNYWGYHLPGLTASSIDLDEEPTGYSNITIEPADNKILYFIPIDETEANNLAEQNP